MSCLDDIVSIGICEDEVSLSGFSLMQAAGMSPVNAEKIATETYGTGYRLLQVKKALAIRCVQNDFLGMLQANNIAVTIADKLYETSFFEAATDMGTYAGYRGVRLHGVHAGVRGGLRKLKIKGVQCYPLTSGSGNIVIIDREAGVEVITNVPVTFVANVINTFTLPEPYIAKSAEVAVVIDNTDINFASAKIACKKGCDGGANNPCGWAEGWDGTKCVREQGYGINVQFFCQCDYEKLMCDLSKSFIGELIWLKWQALVFDEQRKTNRFNNWTTYRTEDLKEYVDELEGVYYTKFNKMLSGGLLNILKNYRDECLDCRGIRVVTNI